MNSSDRIRFGNLVNSWRERAEKLRASACDQPRFIDKRDFRSRANIYETCAEEVEVTVKARKPKATR